MAGKKVDAKAKEKRQKMILAGGMVVLVVLMAVQLPKLMHRSTAAPPPPPVTTTNADGSTVPAPVTATPTGLAPPSVNTSATAVAATPTGLADTDLAPVSQEGQLVHFDLFASKDPFVQQVKDAGPAGSTPSSAGGSSSGGSTATTPKADTTAVARISVDGAVEQVVAGGDFPLAAPVFHLESFGASSAQISVVSGQYQDGRATLTLQKGKELTLENMTDATRYKVVFLGRELVATKDLDPALLGSTSTATTTTPGLSPTAPTTTSATTTTAASTTTTASN